MIRTRIARVLTAVALLATGPGATGWAGSGDYAARTLSRVAQAAARGNLSSAVYQAVPGASWDIHDRTRVTAGRSGVGVSQAIPGLNRAGGKILGFNGSVNAHAGLTGDGKPRLSENVRLGTGNRFFRTSTTVSRA